MRQKLFSLLALCLVCPFFVPAQDLLSVVEDETKVVLQSKKAEIFLKIDNRQVRRKARLALELLDVGGEVRARTERRLAIESGRSEHRLYLPLHDLIAAAESELGWYRLRYEISDDQKSRPTGGLISLSEIMTDAFDLQMSGSNDIYPGMNYRVRLRAVHPRTKQPVKGVKLTGEILLDLHFDDENEEHKVTAEGLTDANGFAYLNFRIPPDRELSRYSRLEITGEKYGLASRIEEFLETSGSTRNIFVTTDKPLYQPGQIFNARGILMETSPTGQSILADTEIVFSIEDESGTLLFRQQVTTSPFGIAALSWPIPENAKLGTYRIRIEDEEGDYIGYETFKVSRYELPQFVVATRSDRDFYLTTENTAEITIRADYLFGKPVAKGRVRVVRENPPRRNSGQPAPSANVSQVIEGEADENGTFVTRINLGEAQDHLARDSSRRYFDLHFAAYVTDPTTNQTEQKRFDLRMSREAIHIYLTGEFDRRHPHWPLSYFVTTSYADGRPAPATVAVSAKYRNKTEFRPLAEIKTNAYGAGRLQFSPPPGASAGNILELALLAADGRQQTGTIRRGISFGGDSELDIRTEKVIYRPHEPVKAEILSTEKDALVFVDLVQNQTALEGRMVRLKNGRAEVKFAYRPDLKGELALGAYTQIIDREGASRMIKSVRGIIYPASNDLRLDTRMARETYRPNEEVKIDFSVLAPGRTPLESALGIVVFDKAVEEQVRTSSEFGGRRGMFSSLSSLLGLDESFGGISRKDINEVDSSKPISNDLQMAAEAILGDVRYWPVIYNGRRDAGQASSIYADFFEKQLAPVEETLKKAYAGNYSYPTDRDSLLRMLGEANIEFEALIDPWGTKYELEFDIDDADDILHVESSGADKKPGTADDFTALKMGFNYFLPVGALVDRAAADYHRRTGRFIRSREVLSAELGRLGVDLHSLRDRWNRPYHVEFGVEGRKYTIVFHSQGANGVKDEYSWNSDDFDAWTTETDYFSAAAARIRKILGGLPADRRPFPRNEAEFRQFLIENDLDPASLADAYEQPVYFRSFTYAKTAGKTAALAEKTSSGTEGEDLVAIKLRSKGADLAEGTDDDFDLAVFSGTVVRKPVSGEAAAAQTVSPGEGAMRGIVKDAAGAFVTEAEVTATNTETEDEFAALTDENGEFWLDGLPPGTYLVRVSSDGFVDLKLSNIAVSAGALAEFDLAFAAAGVELPSVEGIRGVSTIDKPSIGRGSRTGYGFGFGSGGGSGSGNADAWESHLPNSTPRLREYFPETLVWQPELVTDAAGRASLKFRLADNLTTWKLYAIASDRQGRIGVAEREFRVFQPFFVDLQPPRYLTEGDEIYLPAPIRNYTDARQSVAVSMAPAEWFTQFGGAERQIEIEPNASENAVFGFRAIAAAKDARQRVTAFAGGESDAIEKPVTVRPNGQEIVRTESKLFRRAESFDINFPPNALPNTPRAELRIYPNLFAHVTDSIEGLLRRPYGCGEQTVSSTYPNLMILKFVKSEAELRQKAQKYLEKGYQRLLGYQTADGGFSYWGAKEPADTALTAYALRFLHDAREFIAVDENAVARAQQWLSSRQASDGSWTRKFYGQTNADPSQTVLFTAYVARTLATIQRGGQNADQALPKALAYLTAHSAKIEEPYALALFGLATLDAGRVEEARIVAERLEKMALYEGDTAFWKLATSTPFYGWGKPGQIEATALVLQLLIREAQVRSAETAERKTLVSKATLFLLGNKDRYGVWYSTQTTINVLDAFLTAPAEEKNGPGGRLQIILNGEPFRELTISREQAAPISLDLGEKLDPAANRLEIRSSDNSILMAQVVSAHYIDWKDADAARNANEAPSFRLEYRCDRLNAAIMQEVTCSVETERLARSGEGMLLAEIGLPPGADVDRESLQKTLESNPSLSRYDVLPDRIVVYLWARPGGSRFEFRFRPRYAINAQTPPSRIYDYYNPEAQTWAAPLRFVVK